MSHCETQRNLRSFPILCSANGTKRLVAFTQRKHGSDFLQLYQWDKVFQKCEELYSLCLMSGNGTELPESLCASWCVGPMSFSKIYKVKQMRSGY
jgi:hypothetical protein